MAPVRFPLPFSPHYDFIVGKAITLNGKHLSPGAPFPKDGMGDRALRRLYEQRRIVPVPPRAEALPAWTGVNPYGGLDGPDERDQGSPRGALASADPRAAGASVPAASTTKIPPPVQGNGRAQADQGSTPKVGAGATAPAAHPENGHDSPENSAAGAQGAKGMGEDPSPPPAAPVLPLRAVHKGFGQWAIEDATGAVVRAGLSKDEALAQAPRA